MGDLQVYVPEDLGELSMILKLLTPKSKFLSGGTDLSIALQRGTVEPDQIVVLSRIKEFQYIKENTMVVEIGAGTTFSEIAKNQVINKYYPALAQAATDLGSVQIRNMASIGGNIANASPAGDSLPVLCMLDAKIEVAGPSGKSKEYSVDDLITGAGRTNLQFNEVILNIRIPVPKPYFRNAFIKLGNRTKVTTALINIALGVVFDENKKRINKANLVLGGIYEKVLPVPEVECLLENKEINIDLLEAVSKKLSNLIENKHRASSLTWEYKKQAVKGAVYDLADRLFPEISF